MLSENIAEKIRDSGANVTTWIHLTPYQKLVYETLWYLDGVEEKEYAGIKLPESPVEPPEEESDEK